MDNGRPRAPCPTCQRPVDWTEGSRWRPFCSERCRLIDLGAWASGQRAIAGEPLPEDSLDSEQRDDGAAG